MQVLIFEENDELYAIDIHLVSEIIKYSDIELSGVPGGECYIEGMMFLRDVPICVINSFVLLDLTPCELGDRASVIILEHPEGNKYGITCTNVVEILNIEVEIQNDITNPDSYSRGVFIYKETIVILLDGDKIFKNLE